ncbi:MAG: restriction endonuclease subunit S [Oscillospiraceae bacterium]|nr:restriction endonuclease subunit S [Oscillospiraceae bacterium]
MFEIETPKAKFNANALTFDGGHPYVARGEVNNGIRGWIDKDECYLNKENTISFGQDTATLFYQSKPYFTGDKIKIFDLKAQRLNRLSAHFLITCMKKAFSTFSWGSSSYSVKNLEQVPVLLPVTLDNFPDFSYMEDYISYVQSNYIEELTRKRNLQLNAYLKVTGLVSYALNATDRKVLSHEPTWGEFRIGDLFDNIQQGSRLKKLDQIDGDLPFIMAGTTNTGLVKYVGNTDVRSFSENSITIDIFGNVFYRNYKYAAGDDTGVYRCEKEPLSREVMLYYCTTLELALLGKFSFGKKLRSSQSHDMLVTLPTTLNNTPDFAYMERYIKAQQKLIIDDVIRGLDLEIAVTKMVVKTKITPLKH